jgi:hypothetical protein
MRKAQSSSEPWALTWRHRLPQHPVVHGVHAGAALLLLQSGLVIHAPSTFAFEDPSATPLSSQIKRSLPYMLLLLLLLLLLLRARAVGTTRSRDGITASHEHSDCPHDEKCESHKHACCPVTAAGTFQERQCRKQEAAPGCPSAACAAAPHAAGPPAPRAPRPG